jgi:hypothetical protein
MPSPGSPGIRELGQLRGGPRVPQCAEEASNFWRYLRPEVAAGSKAISKHYSNCPQKVKALLTLPATGGNAAMSAIRRCGVSCGWTTCQAPGPVQYRTAEVRNARWPRVAAKGRISLVEGLMAVTPVLVTNTRGAPDAELLRQAMRKWAFNPSRRETPMPPDIEAALRWLARSSVPMSALQRRGWSATRWTPAGASSMAWRRLLSTTGVVGVPSTAR